MGDMAKQPCSLTDVRATTAADAICAVRVLPAGDGFEADRQIGTGVIGRDGEPG